MRLLALFALQSQNEAPILILHHSGKADAGKNVQSLSPDSRTQLQPCAADPKISGLMWNVDDLVFVWMKLLHMFGKVNTIKDPKIHAKAVGVLTDVIAILLQAENAIPHKETLKGA